MGLKLGVKEYINRYCFTTLWANSADNRLMIFFLFFPRKQDLI